MCNKDCAFFQAQEKTECGICSLLPCTVWQNEECFYKKYDAALKTVAEVKQREGLAMEMIGEERLNTLKAAKDMERPAVMIIKEAKNRARK